MVQDTVMFKGRSLLSAHGDELGSKVSRFLNLGYGGREDKLWGGHVDQHDRGPTVVLHGAVAWVVSASLKTQGLLVIPPPLPCSLSAGVRSLASPSAPSPPCCTCAPESPRSTLT